MEAFVLDKFKRTVKAELWLAKHQPLRVRELLKLAAQSGGKMILDFHGVMFMSSSMIGRVVILNKKCKADNIQLTMCNLAPSIMEVFEVTRLNKVFTITDSVDDAPAQLG